MLLEVEHCVNSRPLTHVPVDPQDEEALTLNHFLIGNSSGKSTPGRYEASAGDLRKQWKLAQAFTDAFWERWLRKYVPTLIACQKWLVRQVPLKKGDLVLIVDNQAPRNTWRKGVISETFPSTDGQVRSAKEDEVERVCETDS